MFIYYIILYIILELKITISRSSDPNEVRMGMHCSRTPLVDEEKEASSIFYQNKRCFDPFR